MTGNAQQPGSSLRDGIDPYEHLEGAATADRCPHCGGVGRPVEDEELRYVCSLCGGPRFASLAPGLVAPEPALRGLREAQQARKTRATWTAAMFVALLGQAVGAIGGVALGALVGWKAMAVVGVLLVLPLTILMMLSSKRMVDARRRIAPALDKAWAALAAGAAHSGQASSPTELARALGVGPTRGEELHDVLAVDAELGASASAPRVRIQNTEFGEPPASALAPDPRFDALEPGRQAAAQAEEVARSEAEATDRESVGRAKTIVAMPGRDGTS